MIFGNGMVAKAFQQYGNNDSVLIFASGVSNSNETDLSQFTRERSALKEAMQRNHDKLLVYFSTCSIEDKDICASLYVQHKLAMEKLISESHEQYLICRLPQAVGRSSTRTTLVNYLYDKIVTNAEFVVWKKTIRYLIDIDDAGRIVSYTIDQDSYRNRTLNVSALRYSVEDIVKTLENILKMKARYTLIEKGIPYLIDNSNILSIVKELNIEFNEEYLYHVIKKITAYVSHI